MEHSHEVTDDRGQVRVRSNVCLRNHDHNLIPGDAIRAYQLDLDELTTEQAEEVMRYVPCCLCHRSICEIRQFGCDNYTCRRQGLISRDDASKKKEEQFRQDDAR